MRTAGDLALLRANIDVRTDASAAPTPMLMQPRPPRANIDAISRLVTREHQ
jgi:hypothetical protein